LKTIYFRTRGGSRQGWGNIYRLLLIYDFLKKKNKLLFIFEGNKEVSEFLKKKKIQFLRLKEGISIDEEKKIIFRLDKPNVTILEMLDCKYSRQKIYKNISKKLLVLDDVLKNKYCADLLVCAQKTYDKKKYINSLIGYDYYPLRKEFKKFINKQKIIQKKISNILICLGGSSYITAYKKLIEYFRTKNFNVTFVFGNEKSKIIKDELKIQKFNSLKTTNNLAKLIFYSDLAIVGGGYTKIEAAYMNTPMVVFPVQQHQQKLVENFKKFCSVPFLPLPKNTRSQDIEKIINFYNYKKRKKIYKILHKKFQNNKFDEILNYIVQS
jgi:spore coat polysaccharide biosynthesis predicted glycosyltransferase SpsG